MDYLLNLNQSNTLSLEHYFLHLRTSKTTLPQLLLIHQQSELISSLIKTSSTKKYLNFFQSGGKSDFLNSHQNSCSISQLFSRKDTNIEEAQKQNVEEVLEEVHSCCSKKAFVTIKKLLSKQKKNLEPNGLTEEKKQIKKLKNRNKILNDENIKLQGKIEKLQAQIRFYEEEKKQKEKRAQKVLEKQEMVLNFEIQLLKKAKILSQIEKNIVKIVKQEKSEENCGKEIFDQIFFQISNMKNMVISSYSKKEIPSSKEKIQM